MTTTAPVTVDPPVPDPVVDPVTDPVPAAAPAPAPPDRLTTHRARTAAEQGENLGRIVLYHQVESPQNPAIVTPAVIQAVRDTDPVTVRLFVCGHGGPDLVDDVAHGFAVGEWSLPGEAPPPPALTALVPDTVVLGAPSFTLRVLGTGFAAGTVITFAGHDEPTTVVSATEVTTGVDMALWLGPDTVPVTVRTADGQVSAELPFTFTAAPAAQAAEAEAEPEPPARARRR